MEHRRGKGDWGPGTIKIHIRTCPQKQLMMTRPNVVYNAETCCRFWRPELKGFGGNPIANEQNISPDELVASSSAAFTRDYCARRTFDRHKRELMRYSEASSLMRRH